LEDYTESDLKYIEERLAMQYIENGKQFNFYADKNDPVELLKIYGSRGNSEGEPINAA
jgi:hypothetical protein